MNPGAAEETGKVVRTIVDALRSEPLSLALVIMNFVLLLLMFYVIRTATQTRHDEMDRLFNQQKELVELLARCKT